MERVGLRQFLDFKEEEKNEAKKPFRLDFHHWLVVGVVIGGTSRALAHCTAVDWPTNETDSKR